MQYITTLTDYNINLVHRAGKLNKADALSRWPNYNDGHEDNMDITALLDILFVHHLETIDEFKNGILHVMHPHFTPH